MASPQAERLAEQHRVQQVALRAGVSRDVVALLRDLFDVENADRTWPAIRSILAAIAVQQRGTSATLANTYYGQARAEADVSGAFLPINPAALAEELLKVVLDATGIAAFKRAIALGRTPEEALQIAGVTLSGSVSRLVLSGGRDQILGNVREDRQAVGWARLTDADPCAFCSMLASRGPVYRSKQTAKFEAHDHCACMPVAAWSRDEAWLNHSRDLYEQWQDITQGQSGADARRAWRRHWDNRKGA
ncbi:hypothetical protein [Nonomuraea basaltis]|uniref:VG15 protein n=1 Tax=Nonomuraea basaltis TaxID=2495887 RepID=UPI00110C6006|nr:hypothetical protein [Nonomuraea basaltis]TMS00181.1 hypothetical protein EJK15_03660 [Nonomuraea basaltis]